jgi:hypothetical protein
VDLVARFFKNRRSAAAAVLALSLVLGASAAAASSWTAGLAASSKGQGQASSQPAAPINITATCSLVALKITVGWDAVPNATTYTVYQSSTGANGTYTSVQTGITGTSWQTGVLVLGTFYYKVVAYVGSNWVSPLSVASPGHTITIAVCT